MLPDSLTLHISSKTGEFSVYIFPCVDNTSSVLATKLKINWKSESFSSNL